MGHIAEALSLFFFFGGGGGGGGGGRGAINQIQESVANVYVSNMYAPTFIENPPQLKI